ncbi:phosphoribosyltransferase domain-containing protein [uncultured Nocardioides sp.]|uniref:phosphoribosyltransferase domain-containing protein n=1 Tax=uncultured Nocardioides sp. TaxID=198441 RepID=UPI0026277138|nr:phosphoribosyltransferase domain-containing protein [uncultured Nocardioides sp.]
MSAPDGRSWVREHLGLDLVPLDPDRADEALWGLALRRNPRRLHLVVSPVLAKHVPVAPARAREVADRLADAVLDALDGATPSLVLGYAETATGLGHLVAERLTARDAGAPYLHSTRRPGTSALNFEEEHSHATTHRLLPDDPDLLHGDGPVVLVDDEVTTGTTARNTVAALQRLAPRSSYVVASLLDLRPAAEPDTHEVAGAVVHHVALLRAETRTDGARDEHVAAALAADPPDPDAPLPAATGAVEDVTAPWPAGVPDGGRHAFRPTDAAAFDAAVADLADRVRPLLHGRVHVLGTEELMHLPLRLAEALTAGHDDEVTVSSTTRSPVVVLDDPGYAVRHGLAFRSHDGGSGPDDTPARYAYNLAPGAFGTAVLVLDPATGPDGAADLVARLRVVAPRVVVLRLRDGDDAG